MSKSKSLLAPLILVVAGGSAYLYSRSKAKKDEPPGETGQPGPGPGTRPGDLTEEDLGLIPITEGMTMEEKLNALLHNQAILEALMAEAEKNPAGDVEQVEGDQPSKED